MKVQPTQIAGVLIVEPDVFGDDRGFFMESYNEREMRKIGIDAHFVQDNHSARNATCFADCITRSVNRRASWFVWLAARFLTLPLTFDAILLRLEDG